MAKKNRLTRYLSLVFDRTAARRMEEEAEASLARAGKRGSDELEKELAQGGRKAARALTAALNREYRARMAKAKRALAEGTIDEKEFQREGNRAAIAFNKGLSAGLKQLQGKLSATEATALAGRFKGITAVGTGGLLETVSGKLLAAGGTLFAAQRIKDTALELFRLGTAAEETASKFQTTFGDASAQMDAFLDQWAELAGLNRTVARDFSATIATIAQGMGFARRESAAFSERVLRLAGDLQSFHNIPIEETFAAIKSGLAGEVEPMRRFGVMLSVAKVQQEALRETGKTTTAALTTQEKALAALTLMYREAGPAVGDLERTQGSTANQTRQLAAALEDVHTEIAIAVLPSIKDLVSYLKEHEPELKTIGSGVAEFARRFAESTIKDISDIEAAYENLKQKLTRPPRSLQNFGRDLRDEAPLDDPASEFTLGGVQATHPDRAPGTKSEQALRDQAAAAERARAATEAAEAAAKRAADERTKALNEEVAALAKAGRLHELSARDMARIATLEQEFGERLKDGNLSLVDRVDLLDKLATLAPYGLRAVTPDVAESSTVPTVGGIPVDADAARQQGAAMRDAQAKRDAAVGGMILHPIAVPVVPPEAVSDFDRALSSVMEDAGAYGQEAAYQMSSAFQDAFGMMMEEGATFGSFMEALGKGMAGAVLAGIAQIASAKSAEMFARAIEAGATALLTGNPAAAASIPEWIAAGTAYAALAGLAGAARGAVTGGAGAIPPSTRDAGLGVAQGAERQGPEVHIYIDPLDPARPAVQRVVYRANQLGEERFNGAEVHVHPAQRGAA